MKKQGQETKTNSQQLKEVDYGTMLVNKGSRFERIKTTHPMDKMANLVQSWGLVHSGLDCQTWTLFYKKLLDSTTISNL